MEDLYGQKLSRTRKLLAKEKDGLFQGRSTSFVGRVGVYHAGYLPRANQEIPDGPVKVHISAVKSWFAVLGGG